MMARLKNSRTVWQRVTNEYVAKTYGQPECKNCNGTGKATDDALCSCATLAFRRQYGVLVTEGKLREHVQRIGNRDLKWLEYREIGAV